MIQFFYECPSPNCRIPVPAQARSERTAYAVDEIHAWHQPPEPAAVYFCYYRYYRPANSTPVALANSKIICAAFAEALPPCCNNFFKSS